MSTTKLVEKARAEVNYKETGDNNTKYNEWFYGKATSASWCAIFVSWCADQAGILTTNSTASYPYIKKESAVASLKTFYKNNKRDLSLNNNSASSNYPKAGDLIFWKTDSHVGIISEVGTSTIKVVSGNYSDAVQESSFSNWATSGTFDFVGSNHTNY